MADVCSVFGGPGRNILNLIKGVKIEPALKTLLKKFEMFIEHMVNPVGTLILVACLTATHADEARFLT